MVKLHVAHLTTWPCGPTRLQREHINLGAGTAPFAMRCFFDGGPGRGLPSLSLFPVLDCVSALFSPRLSARSARVSGTGTVGGIGPPFELISAFNLALLVTGGDSRSGVSWAFLSARSARSIARCFSISFSFSVPLRDRTLYFRHASPHSLHIAPPARAFGAFHQVVDSFVRQTPQVKVRRSPGLYTDPSSSSNRGVSDESNGANAACAAASFAFLSCCLAEVGQGPGTQLSQYTRVFHLPK